MLLSSLPLDHNDRRGWLGCAGEKLIDGRLKLFVTTCLARLLREECDLFQKARYAGLPVEGERDKHVPRECERVRE